MPKRRQKGSTSAKKSARPNPTPPSPPSTSAPKSAPARAAARAPTTTARPAPRWGLPTWLIAILAALVLLAIAAVGYVILKPGSGAASPQAGALAIPEVKMADEGAGHVAEGSAITYRNNPPSSGKHYPNPKPWGVYDEPVTAGYFVHNLEHGGVVVLYDCKSGCPDVVSQLKDAQQTFPKGKYGEVKLLVTPYSGLPDGVQVTALAWDYQLDFRNGFNRDQLLAFYTSHLDRGPEDVP